MNVEQGRWEVGDACMLLTRVDNHFETWLVSTTSVCVGCMRTLTIFEWPTMSHACISFTGSLKPSHRQLLILFHKNGHVTERGKCEMLDSIQSDLYWIDDLRQKYVNEIYHLNWLLTIRQSRQLGLDTVYRSNAVAARACCVHLPIGDRSRPEGHAVAINNAPIKPKRKQ